MADFPVDDITVSPEVEMEEPLLEHAVGEVPQVPNSTWGVSGTPEDCWELFTDGSSNAQGAGVGCVLLTP